MKGAVFCFLVLAAVALARPNEQYTTKYDDFNVDEVLTTERLLEAYFKCLVGKGPCTAEGKELKVDVPDALQDGCAKCSPKQREIIEKVIAFLINNKPEYWTELKAMYDPTGEYSKKYEDKEKALKGH